MGTLALSHAAGFRLLAHTADIGLEATAATREELFVSAARGLRTLIYGNSPARPTVGRRVEVVAEDLPALLVVWLNEVLYLCESASLVPAGFQIEHLGEQQLRATVTGEPFDAAGHARKNRRSGAGQGRLRTAGA